MNVADVLTAYIAMRDDLKEKTKAHGEWAAKRKADMNKLELWIKTRQLELGTDSLKAGGHTAFQKTTDSVSIDDKEAFKKFLAQQFVDVIATAESGGLVDAVASCPAFDLITLSANKTNCNAYKADHQGVMPDGVAYYSEKVIQIRKGKEA